MCRESREIKCRLLVLANGFLLRWKIQQSQCCTKDWIKIEGIFCPSVPIHKYLNKPFEQPLRQHISLTKLCYSHTGQRWQYDQNPGKSHQNTPYMGSPLRLRQFDRGQHRNELYQEPAEHEKRYGLKQKPQEPHHHYIQMRSLLFRSRDEQPINGLQNAPNHAAQHSARACSAPIFCSRQSVENSVGICPKNRCQPKDLLHIRPRFPTLIIGDGLSGRTQPLRKLILCKLRPFPQVPYVLSNIAQIYHPPCRVYHRNVNLSRKDSFTRNVKAI